MNIWKWFNGPSKEEIEEIKKQHPKYRIQPKADGGYKLEKLSVVNGSPMYFCICGVETEEEADETIANMERETKYYRVDK